MAAVAEKRNPRNEKRETEVTAERVKDVLSLLALSDALRAVANVDLSELSSTYTPQEIAEALKIVSLVREFRCDFESVGAALRQREYHNARQHEYYQARKKKLREKQPGGGGQNKETTKAKTTSATV